jgi:uroporphyrinogen-III synthase
LNENPLNEKPFEKKIIENGFEPWVVPLIEISTIKPRSSTKIILILVDAIFISIWVIFKNLRKWFHVRH